MDQKIPEWRWFGHVGHLCVGSHCRFHLTTQVGDYLVSTLGEYVPPAAVQEILAQCRNKPLEGVGEAREADWMRKFGFEEVGYNRVYESMVFPAGEPCHTRTCGCGLPEILFPEVDNAGYMTPAAATLGHYELCHKWESEAPVPKEETHTPEEGRKLFRESMEELRDELDPFRSGWEGDGI